ncbi:MAG: nitronate monooxygenase [Bdellovibrio sp. CG12_big_fil_rev_8_21_14_0_65_39_13]|nr:MAG: nitronate monooxygenase [Bdellovibrio sp. CG22_combo_CG10-13_8_21_14_all_39_27]PIQ60291.1 MAG: nitronate monooxygenase [Bdellovibrio sp. CG12_big_fil_rev_8_21_14_0_65_39_13]PIR34726.1 MAG: nitronate monooxygenase [Bdellovibrio sp. CG11_big_fil_rev_8_21_14_0_20_39_38]
MYKPTSITKLLGIETPIIQAGMVWVSGGKLAAAAANAGALGLIGAGSMKPDLLKHHIEKAQSLTTKPIGVNVPLLYKDVESQLKVALECGIRIFFTSAGSPKKYTTMLKDHGAIVVHVTSTPELALKCEQAGVDAVVAEGFEAGGHNGRDEITTLALIPQVVSAVKIPVIAAGGIATGSQIVAAMALGAQAVQMGSRFAVTKESSAHENFKKAIMTSGPGDTKLMMKNLVPVRLLKNKFAEEIAALEDRGADAEALEQLLGKGRAKSGMLEGDLERGELEIGQVSAMIRQDLTCKELMNQLSREVQATIKNLNALF